MQRILCYGDSNTFGFISGSLNFANRSCARFSEDTRWPKCLQALLENTEVIEEGLSGRSVNAAHKLFPYWNGWRLFPAIVESHAPFDIVILALGGNDLQGQFQREPVEVAANLKQYIHLLQQQTLLTAMTRVPAIVIVGVPPLHAEQAHQAFPSAGWNLLGDKVAELNALYQALAVEQGCHYFDLSALVTLGGDGLHLTAKDHRIVALKLAELLRDIPC